MNKETNIEEALRNAGLKVTPQRKWVLAAIYSLNNHPSAEQIISHIKKQNNPITAGTVYRVLEDLVKAELITKAKTNSEILRYDGILENHHHLYCNSCDYIEDYSNTELDTLLNDFFQKHPIHDFKIKSFNLTLNGSFSKHKNQKHS